MTSPRSRHRAAAERPTVAAGPPAAAPRREGGALALRVLVVLAVLVTALAPVERW